MKLLLLVIALAMTHVVLSQTGTEDSIYWYDADLSDLNSPLYSSRNILNLGVQHATTEAIQFGTLPPGNYYIEDVLSIENGDDDPYFYYRFNVLLGDGQGNFIKLMFIHAENLQTREKRITHYEFVENSGQVDSPFASWEAVDETELDTNQDLKDSLDSGIQNVITQGIELRLLSTNYHLSDIYSIKRQSDEDGGMNYRFNVQLENDQGGHAHVIFVVKSPLVGEKEFPSYYFLDISGGGDIDNEEDTEVPLPPSEDSEDDGAIPPPEENDFGDLGDWDPEDDEGFDISDIWEPVDLTILNTNSDYRDALNIGVRKIIDEINEYGTLPPGNYHLEDVLSVRWSEDFNYRFAVVLADDQGTETIITFGVFQYPNRKDLANYRIGLDEGQEEPPVGIWEAVDETEYDTNQDLIDSLNYGIQDVITRGIELGQLSTPDYHLSEAYSIKRQYGHNQMHYRFNLELQNDQGGNIHVIFIVHSPSEGEKAVVWYLFLDIQERAPSIPDEETNNEEEFD